MDYCALVGRNLRRERRAANLTQEALAHETGLDRTYISDIERGRRNPSLRLLQDVATVLRTHPALLLLEESEAEAVRQVLGLPPSKPAGGPENKKHRSGRRTVT